MTQEQREAYEKILANDHFLDDGKCLAPEDCCGITHHTVTRDQYMRAVELSV